MHRTNNRGFTLIELMIVISIIVVLMGLVITAVGGAGESATALKCQNNIKQVVMLLKGYQNRYQDYPHEDGKAFLTWIYFIGDTTETSYLKCPGGGAKDDKVPSLGELTVVRDTGVSVADVYSQFHRYGYWPARTISYAGPYGDKDSAHYSDERWYLGRLLQPTADDRRGFLENNTQWGESMVPLMSDDNDGLKNHARVINIGFADGSARPFDGDWDDKKLPFAALTSK